jgi:cyclophilin family peptidyl-prolyl cis-trans isomerase
MKLVLGVCAAMLLVVGAVLAQGSAKPAAQPSAAPGPVVTMDTVKGTIVFELFAADAPKSVDHIVKLIQRRFYDGQSIHRVVGGQLVQFGDPQSRNMTLKELWGRSGSGNPIGVAEISKKRTHRRGTVSLANAGDPRFADSQMFFALAPIPGWNGRYAVIGQVTKGLEVLPKLQVGDRIKKVTVTVS